MEWTQDPPSEPGVYLHWSGGAMQIEVIEKCDTFQNELGGWWLKLPYPVPGHA